MISRRWFLTTSFGASTCLLLAACGTSAAPSAPAATSAPAAAKPQPQPTQAAPAQPKASLPQIRIVGGAQSFWPSQLPIIAARHQGFFDEVGFPSYSWNLAGNDGPALAALISGSADVTVATGTQSVIQLANKGEKIYIIGSISNRIPLSIVSSKDITSIAQLKGKKVGANPEPYPVDTYLAKGLATAGLSLSDVEIVRLGADPERYAAIQNGLVDATMAGTTIIAPLVDQGFNRLIDVGELFPNYLQRTYPVNGTFLEQHPDAVDAFMLAIVKSHIWLHDTANVPKIKEYLQADGFQNDERYLDGFIADGISLIPPNAMPTRDGTQLVLDEMHDQAPNVTFESLMRLDAVMKADKQLGLATS
jgi:ABC-type nitrate/sulfonate/bicarbonate transport system substrate-binding protein